MATATTSSPTEPSDNLFSENRLFEHLSKCDDYTGVERRLLRNHPGVYFTAYKQLPVNQRSCKVAFVPINANESFTVENLTEMYSSLVEPDVDEIQLALVSRDGRILFVSATTNLPSVAECKAFHERKRDESSEELKPDSSSSDNDTADRT